MKPKLLLTFTAAFYLLGGVAGFFMAGGYDYNAYEAAVLTTAFAVLFWMARDLPASKALTAVLLAGFIVNFGGSLVALYGQWSGTYMDTAIGYIPGLVWLGLAVWFFLVGRANMSTAA